MTDIGLPAEATDQPVRVGEEIEPFGVPLTLQRLVMEAGANRDFSPLHYDSEYAIETGAPDAYANTIFIEALIEAALRTWMGPRGWLEELEIRMEAFNTVGSFVAAHGRVREVRDTETGWTVSLDIWVEADQVRTVTGTALVSLPR